jgi:transcriptional regulator with XRE-family HTH domain
MTQAEVAEQVGIERASLSMIETGKDTAGLATLQALADLFNTSLDYLQRGTAPGNAIEGGRFIQDSDQLAFLDMLEIMEEPDRLALARAARAMAAAAAARKPSPADMISHADPPVKNRTKTIARSRE